MIDRIRMHKALDWVIDSCSGGRAAMDGLDWPPKWHGFAYHADALEPGKTPPGVKYSMLYLGGIERKATGKFEGFTNYPTKISEFFCYFFFCICLWIVFLHA